LKNINIKIRISFYDNFLTVSHLKKKVISYLRSYHHINKLSIISSQLLVYEDVGQVELMSGWNKKNTLVKFRNKI